MYTLLLTAFILGITSNLHCIGMCGPIAMAIPINRATNWTILFGVLQYNLGRIFSYSLLGLLVGTVGLPASTFGILQWLSIGAGFFLILFAWRKWLSVKLNARFPDFGLNKLVSNGLGKALKSKSIFKLVFLGMLNGFLPCGMVYVALMNSLLAGAPIPSAYTMIVFGLGTLPAMIFVGFAANRINGNLRQKLNKIVPVLLTIVGLLIILRGMNLGIPYLSPKVTLTKTAHSNKPKVEISCCRKTITKN